MPSFVGVCLFMITPEKRDYNELEFVSKKKKRIWRYRMKSVSERIADSLIRFMKAKNISVEKLAELSGVSTRSINKLRNGATKDPSVSTLIAICDVFNCSIDEIIERDCCSVDEKLMMNYHTLPEKEKKIAELILSDKSKEV